MSDEKRCKLCNDGNLSIEMIGDSIECPVCLSSILDPPVYMCARSHIFCEDCHTTLKKENQDCPVCKGDLAGNRNLFAERMLDSLPKAQCKNQGCSFKKADPKKVEIHGDTCQYRLVTCLKCKDQVPLINLSEHQVNIHQWKIFHFEFGKYDSHLRAGIPSDLPSGFSAPLMIKVDGEDQFFYFHCFVHDSGYHSLWISQSQSKKDIRKYKYTINFLCAKAYENRKIERMLTYSGFCIPTDVTTENIKNKTPCMWLPKDFLLQNLDKEEKYHFELRIDN